MKMFIFIAEDGSLCMNLSVHTESGVTRELKSKATIPSFFELVACITIKSACVQPLKGAIGMLMPLRGCFRRSFVVTHIWFLHSLALRFVLDS